RTFGFLAGLQTSVAYQERLTAFRCKMAEKKLTVREDWIHTADQSMAATSAWASHVLKRERPSAFMCSNDFMAIGLLKAAQSLGVSIPRDLSVVGFDDIEPAALVSPALTTMRTPAFETGQQAVRQLSLQIKLAH